MAHFDYKNLSPTEFEAMCKRVLLVREGAEYERFTEGRDGGIDLRFIADSRDTTIYQCKRYCNYANLYRVLKTDEVAKVCRLAPCRYGIITTCGLTPKNKKQIADLFTPYIASERDIVGRDELDDLLSSPEYSHIVEQTLGLWWSSFDVLRRTVCNGIIERSSFNLSVFVERNRHTYWTAGMEQVFQKLLKEHVVILEGPPGIGKTTAAQMMVLKMVAQGYVFVDMKNGVEGAEQAWSEKDKQVFYYDDFLGSNYREAITHDNATAICEFISRVHASSNKVLVLTSRTIILRQRDGASVPLRLNNLVKSPYCCSLGTLSDNEKAHILYHRLRASDLPMSTKKEIIENRNYISIIRHRNFFPRLVAHFLQKDLMDGQLESMPAVSAVKYVMDHPDIIWESVFLHQLSEQEIAVVWAAFLADGISEIKAREVYFAFCGKEQEYKQSLEVLIGTVLERRIDDKNHVDFVLSNSSVGDYLISKISHVPRIVTTVVKMLDTCKVMERFIAIAKENSEKRLSQVVLEECVRLFTSLSPEKEQQKAMIWMLGAEILDYKEDFAREFLSKVKNTDLARESVASAKFMCKAIDLFDQIDEKAWLKKSGFDLNTYSVGELMRHTDDFELCARLFQITKKNDIILEYEYIGDFLEKRLGEYLALNIIPNITNPVFIFDANGDWSISEAEENRILEEIRERLQHELDYYNIPDYLINPGGIVSSFDYRDWFEPSDEEMAKYSDTLLYDRDMADLNKIDPDAEEVAIDAVFNGFGADA